MLIIATCFSYASEFYSGVPPRLPVTSQALRTDTLRTGRWENLKNINSDCSVDLIFLPAFSTVLRLWRVAKIDFSNGNTGLLDLLHLISHQKTDIGA